MGAPNSSPASNNALFDNFGDALVMQSNKIIMLSNKPLRFPIALSSDGEVVLVVDLF